MLRSLNKFFYASSLIRTNNIRLLRMSTEDIQFKVVNNLGLIILNKPKNLNALSFNMEKLLASKLREFESDSNVQAILVKGSGNKAFCAGGDLRELFESRINVN